VKATPPKAATHPHTFAWYVLINRFADTVRNSWGAAQAAAPAKGGKAPAKKEQPKKEEPKKEAVKETKPADDDEMDLFGDDDNDEVSFIYLIGRA
jgi:hypothetical protein